MGSSQKRPNFLVIVADDMGFSDVGCFGGEIKTPNIDKLGHEGVRYTGFHSAAACSPTRAMIMTGTDHHIAGLGNLIEFTNYTGWSRFEGEPVTENGNFYDAKPQRGIPGYEGYLNERVVTIPEILRDGGYHTMMAGKWHLGLKQERAPHSRGFNRSFAMLPGSSNHFNYRPEGEVKNGTPQFLDTSLICLHNEDGKYVDLDDLPKDFYSSNAYGDKIVEYMSEWYQKKSEGKDTSDDPFFAYLAFSAPHWPLQAPKEHIENYRGVYNKGPEVLRQRRLANLIKLDMIDKDTEAHPVVDDRVEGWDEFTEYEKEMSCRSMEAYAGMVECMDKNVGKVLDYLKSIDELDNTFIMFMSDNGAEGAAYEAYPLVKGPLLQHIRKYYDNSFDNIGAANSFVWYGPRWAQAATAPSRLYKLYTSEGGVRVPCIARYPGYTAAIKHDFATVMDVGPTILEMAGLKHPAPTYQGREVAEMRGKTMHSWLKGETDSVHPKDFVQGWELCGRAAIRVADWKALFIPAPKGPHRWQLYNLEKDPGEIYDLSDEYPHKLTELLKHWDQYVEECGVVPLHPELGAYLEATEEQMEENAWIEYEYWKPGGLVEREKFFRTPKKFCTK
ncbi:arylsulfatase [Penicillium cinerascens]|uniref:Arylsulfatase n=1 Tax=Penicillium cinerascens TaxID=70096 RepID=A0A9W9MIN7_9EURO|nr:arylsulfatase [Penicillium cinerascens]KAJ5201862.1 arylsulfatase [Penicillium cinerascens]